MIEIKLLPFRGNYRFNPQAKEQQNFYGQDRYGIGVGLVLIECLKERGYIIPIGQRGVALNDMR